VYHKYVVCVALYVVDTADEIPPEVKVHFEFEYIMISPLLVLFYYNFIYNTFFIKTCPSNALQFSVPIITLLL